MDDLFSVEFWAIAIFAIAVLIALVLTLKEELKYRREKRMRDAVEHEQERATHKGFAGPPGF